MANKVEFGLKNVHFGTYTDTAGVITLGTPSAMPGAISLTLDPESKDYSLYADDDIYYQNQTNNGLSGALSMALFPDAFKTAFLGYVELASGGLAMKKGITKPKGYIIFEGDGDANKRRTILYNVSFSDITRAHNTKEDTEAAETESVDIRVIGDNTTKVVKVTYDPTDTAYDTLFTTPPVPSAT